MESLCHNCRQVRKVTSGTGSVFNRRIARMVCIVSNTPRSVTGFLRGSLEQECSDFARRPANMKGSNWPAANCLLRHTIIRQ